MNCSVDYGPHKFDGCITNRGAIAVTGCSDLFPVATPSELSEKTLTIRRANGPNAAELLARKAGRFR